MPRRATRNAGSASPSTEESPLERARALALRVLAFHARTEVQLRARLVRAGFEAEAEEVLRWAGRLGYLDDVAYARARARALLDGGRAGPRAAERRLVSEGIPSAAAAQAVIAALEERAAEVPRRGEREPAEVTLCRVALAKKLRGGKLPSDAKGRARLSRFLLVRGFGGEVVARVVGRMEELEE